MKVFYNKRYTDFVSNDDAGSVNDEYQSESSTGSFALSPQVYSLDSSDNLHLTLIPGVLRLSSKNFKTTSTKGYIMKEFTDLFNLFPPFMVKTNKIKDLTDKYVVVNVGQTVDKLTGHKQLIGTIERYVGDVGDKDTEKTLCQILSTSHWSRKIDKIDFNKLDLKYGVTLSDLTPNRIDMTSNRMYTVSVDPDGSQDVDDALSIEIVNDHKLIVGVHIADPSSYLIEGSDMDMEVAKRVESIYLSHTTYHMFREELSTNLFSLKEKRSNRTFSVMLDLEKRDDRWDITTKRVTKALVRVDENTTYDRFQHVVDDATQKKSDESETTKLFRLLYDSGKDLYSRLLDPYNRTTYSSKKMVELFMVVANCTVAEQMVLLSKTRCSETALPILIRSQKVSSYDFKDLNMSDSGLGSCIDEVQQSEFQCLVADRVQLKANTAELRYFNAIDTSQNEHASLGMSLYTHFTSPIRRYSDILVHRTLYNLLTDSRVFRLDCLLTNNGVHQMFLMNHYKKFYKRIASLEKVIEMCHDVIVNIGYLPSDRVMQLEGVILDLTIVNDQNKKALTTEKIALRVKCNGVVPIPGLSNDTQDVFNRVNKHLIGTIHTLVFIPLVSDELHTEKSRQFKLFDKVVYKMCFLQHDVRKIRTYL